MARSVIASGGPLLIGVVTAVTASQKAGMAVLVLFFVAGLALLARVREA
ncbi:MFS-type transporter involved in bile tolerance (Atg22 family) [Nitrobacteraceae bacterium AZCC 2161]